MAAVIAVGVGLFALLYPGPLLAGKGVSQNPAANIWVRELGVLLIATGIVAFLVRGQADSPTLRAVLIGNLIIQTGLWPIEPLAYRRGIITKLSGIVPNSVLHVFLAGGFAYYAVTM